MDLNNLYRQMIMEHSKNSKNEGLLDNDNYSIEHLKNPTCGDDIKIQVLIEDDKIIDIRHKGEGCAICCASASMMSEILKGRTLDEAKKIILDFYDLVSGNIKIVEELGDANALFGVSKFPTRIKCATISWKAVENLINR